MLCQLHTSLRCITLHIETIKLIETCLVFQKQFCKLSSAFIMISLYFHRFAREKRLRLWKNYVSNAPSVNVKNKEFTGKVTFN